MTDLAYGGIMAGPREFLASTPGKIVTSVLSIIIVLAVGYFVWQSFGISPEALEANTRWFVDVKTGKPFRAELKIGMMPPIKAPSGENTGYMAEACGWTADGKVRSEPFYVVLNASLDKPEPTFCPDCGRLVVGHNPPAVPGAKPPPTKDEYKSRGR